MRLSSKASARACAGRRSWCPGLWARRKAVSSCSGRSSGSPRIWRSRSLLRNGSASSPSVCRASRPGNGWKGAAFSPARRTRRARPLKRRLLRRRDRVSPRSASRPQRSRRPDNRAWGGRRFDLRGQAERLAQLRPARLIEARAQEAVEVDRRTLGLFPLAKMSDGAQGAGPEGPRPSKENPARNPADGIADRIHDAADRIALRRGAKIRGHGIAARWDAPDEQGLAEIAGLVRQSALGGDVEQATEPESGVEDDAADRNGGGVETPLEDVV